MWCVIPVAGRGTRLESVTRGSPKSLITIGGKTILERLLQNLSSVVTEFCLIVNNDTGEIFRRAIGDFFQGSPVYYVEQPCPFGLAHAVHMAEGIVKGNFLCVLGDNYYAETLVPYIRAWQKTGLSGAVLLEFIPVQNEYPVGLATVYGNRIIKTRKDIIMPRSGENFRICGMFVFPEGIFGALNQLMKKQTTLLEYELEDAIQILIDGGICFAPLHYRGWRRNINTETDLQDVREFVQDIMTD